jgi:hypothetical protein
LPSSTGGHNGREEIERKKLVKKLAKKVIKKAKKEAIYLVVRLLR